MAKASLKTGGRRRSFWEPLRWQGLPCLVPTNPEQLYSFFEQETDQEHVSPFARREVLLVKSEQNVRKSRTAYSSDYSKTHLVDEMELGFMISKLRRKRPVFCDG
jgi:hypothetical protein